MNLVRDHDYDRYLLSLFAPIRARAGLWTLYAFNYEIAKTREVVSDTTLGLIRLQWWREAIAEIYEGKVVRRHEVVQPLAKVIQAYDLSREDFEALIYAREFDLEGVAPANIEGLFHYCDYTTTPLLRLSMKIMGETLDEAQLKSIAVQYAVIGTLRAVPYMMNQRRVFLPQDILNKNNITEQKLFDFKEVQNLSQVIKEVLDMVELFRNDQSKVKSRFLRAKIAMIGLYEEQIHGANYDVFHASLTLAPRCMALRLWWRTIF